MCSRAIIYFKLGVKEEQTNTFLEEHTNTFLSGMYEVGVRNV